jgi:hypothetical protein
MGNVVTTVLFEVQIADRPVKRGKVKAQPTLSDFPFPQAPAPVVS